MEVLTPGIQNKLQGQCPIQYNRDDHKVIVNLNWNLNAFFAIGQRKPQMLALKISGG